MTDLARENRPSWETEAANENENGPLEYGTAGTIAEPDRDQVARFAEILHGQRDQAEPSAAVAVFIGNGNTRHYWFRRKELRYAEAFPGDAEGVNSYMGVCRFKSGSTHRRAASAVLVPGVWADLDLKPDAIDQPHSAAELEAIMAALPEPTMLVATGSGGFHPYWLFPQMSADTEQCKALLQRWHRYLNATASAALERPIEVDSVFDLARIMKVPGTWRWPKGTEGRAPVRLLVDDGPRYGYEQLWELSGAGAEHVPPPGSKGAQGRARQRAGRPSPPPAEPGRIVTAPERRWRPWVGAAVESAAEDLAAMGPDSGRNNALNEAAMTLGGYAAHGDIDGRPLLDRDEVREALAEACEDNGLMADDGREAFEATFASGWDAGQARPCRLPAWMTETEQATGTGTGTVMSTSANTDGAATGTLGPTDEPAPRRLKLTPASDIEPEPVIWAWEPKDLHGRIPAGALTLAAGREGTGKSSFGIWLAAELSRGTLPGTFYGTPRNVFYAAVEDSWSRTLVPRLIAAGADLDRIFRVDVEDTLRDTETMVSLPRDVDLIAEAVLEHEAAALIVDPLMSTLNAATDAHRTQDVRQALEPLVRMAEQTKALTLGIAHFSKASGTDPAQLISGSGAFKDLARAALAFARDKESGEQVMTQVKNSLGSLDLPSLSYRIDSTDVDTPTGTANVGRLVFTGESERSVEDTLAPQGEGDGTGERDEAQAWLLDYIEEHGPEVEAGEVIKAAEKVGIAKRTLQRARRKAGVKSQKSAFGKGWVWAKDTSLSALGAIAPSPEGATDPTEGAEGARPRELASSAPSVSPSMAPTPKSSSDHCWWSVRGRGEHGPECAECRRSPGGPDAAKGAA